MQRVFLTVSLASVVAGCGSQVASNNGAAQAAATAHHETTPDSGRAQPLLEGPAPSDDVEVPVKHARYRGPWWEPDPDYMRLPISEYSTTIVGKWKLVGEYERMPMAGYTRGPDGVPIEGEHVLEFTSDGRIVQTITDTSGIRSTKSTYALEGDRLHMASNPKSLKGNRLRVDAKPWQTILSLSSKRLLVETETFLGTAAGWFRYEYDRAD